MLTLCRIGYFSEITVSRVCNVNPLRVTCWNELYGDGLRLDSAFVPEDVCVIPATIDKRHSFFVHMQFAGRVVAFIVRNRSCSNNNQALTRMRVPTGASAGCQDITLHIYV